MTDVLVYYFMRRGIPGGEESLSKRRATLETIKGKGEAVMQSQHVVDHTEVDGNGFVIGGTSNEPHSHNELWPYIRSLESRAKSRDSEALKIVEGTGAARKQTLHSESVELRNQARVLRARIEGRTAENPLNPDSAISWTPREQIG
jgi:hypothetical protein